LTSIVDGGEFDRQHGSLNGTEQSRMETDTANDAEIPGSTDTPDHHAHLAGTPFVERFPSGVAGAPIPDMGQGFQLPLDVLGTENIWFPFQSRRDWEFAQWAKNRGPGSTAVTELLAIDGVSL
jgi:hypothetical protein